MVLEFDFRKEKSGLFGTIYRPVARIILIHKKIVVPEIFYVDSGADITLIPHSIGEILDFKNPKPEEITNIRGISEKGVSIVLREVLMQVGSTTIKTRVGWSLIEEIPFLLGREDFFKHFEISFVKNRKTFFKLLSKSI